MLNRLGIRSRELTRDRWAFFGWVVLALGLLLLTVSIPFTIWLIQSSGEPVTKTIAGSLADTATFGDSAKLEIRRAPASSSTDEAGLVSGDDDEISGQDLSAADNARFSDAATLDTQEGLEAVSAETEPTNGPADVGAKFTDSAQFVVRDSEGNIKDQGVTE